MTTTVYIVDGTAPATFEAVLVRNRIAFARGGVVVRYGTRHIAYSVEGADAARVQYTAGVADGLNAAHAANATY